MLSEEFFASVWMVEPGWMSWDSVGLISYLSIFPALLLFYPSKLSSAPVDIFNKLGWVYIWFCSGCTWAGSAGVIIRASCLSMESKFTDGSMFTPGFEKCTSVTMSELARWSLAVLSEIGLAPLDIIPLLYPLTLNWGLKLGSLKVSWVCLIFLIKGCSVFLFLIGFSFLLFHKSFWLTKSFLNLAYFLIISFKTDYDMNWVLF